MKSPVLMAAGALSLLAMGMSAAHAAPMRLGEAPVSPHQASAAVPATAQSVAPAADLNVRVSGSPSGQALVRIDGGTAYTRKTGKHSYKLLLPEGAKVSWMGEVNGKGLRVGSFSHKGLVKGWQRLGHRSGVGAMSTLAWGEESSLALVSDPRINADGALVFKASTRQPLPKTLPSFSLNINRAVKTPRYPVYFDPFNFSSTARAQASAGGDWSASVAFQQLSSDGKTWVNCVSSTNPGELPIKPNPYNFPNGKKFFSWGPTTCGGVTFLASAPGEGGTYINSLTFVGWQSGGYTYAKITGEFALAGNFTFLGTIAQWANGSGSPACPVNGSTCP